MVERYVWCMVVVCVAIMIINGCGGTGAVKISKKQFIQIQKEMAEKMVPPEQVLPKYKITLEEWIAAEKKYMNDPEVKKAMEEIRKTAGRNVVNMGIKISEEKKNIYFRKKGE